MTCTWGAWSSFSECTKSCGSGVKSHSRPWTCRQAGKADQIESVACNESPCNYYNTHRWGNWGPCSVSCGIGVMTRNDIRIWRRTRRNPSHQGLAIAPCNDETMEDKHVDEMDCALCDMVRRNYSSVALTAKWS